MVSGFQLFVQQGPQAGQAFVLNKSIITIGREAGNDIVLESPQISRYHTRLTLQGGVYVVEDMGSTNGTFLNGQRVLRPTPVTTGDLIGVGETILLKSAGSCRRNSCGARAASICDATATRLCAPATGLMRTSAARLCASAIPLSPAAK